MDLRILLSIAAALGFLILFVLQLFIIRGVRRAHLTNALQALEQHVVEIMHANIAHKAQIEMLQTHIAQQLSVSRDMQKEQLQYIASALDKMLIAGEGQAERIRRTVDEKLRAIQQNNDIKLEQVRRTVDEKLQSTLEKRLGESFNIVSERLETLHKGLGEMQSISSQVVDLKNVLSNVKTRGIWGEVQLGAIIEQIMAPNQYGVNVAVVPGANERVEYVIKLPGREGGQEVLLPIDAKFPMEDYQRLVEAQSSGNLAKMEECAKALYVKIKYQAKSISDKYIRDPYTTDFAIMFLPTEGLYAEVLKRAGVIEELQSKYRVVVAGPATLSAMLSSFKMGFKTLVIEKKSKELWALLDTLRPQFKNFNMLLTKTRIKLEEASQSIAKAEDETKKIQNNFRSVENDSIDQATYSRLPGEW